MPADMASATEQPSSVCYGRVQWCAGMAFKRSDELGEDRTREKRRVFPSRQKLPVFCENRVYRRGALGAVRAPSPSPALAGRDLPVAVHLLPEGPSG